MTNTDALSKNPIAEAVMGLRKTGPYVIVIDQPCEMGYHCPICQYPRVLPNGNYDERLHWSEYNGFIWCEVCNRDYPSCLCLPEPEQIEQAIEIFLLTVNAAVHMEPRLPPAKFPPGYGLPAEIKAKHAAQAGTIIDKRESFQDAVRNDPEMTPERKAKWLGEAPSS